MYHCTTMEPVLNLIMALPPGGPVGMDQVSPPSSTKRSGTLSIGRIVACWIQWSRTGLADRASPPPSKGLQGGPNYVGMRNVGTQSHKAARRDDEFGLLDERHIHCTVLLVSPPPPGAWTTFRKSRTRVRCLCTTDNVPLATLSHADFIHTRPS